MSKAFDTINIHTLLRKLLQTNIPCTIIKSSQTTLRDAKPTQHVETTHSDNVNLKLAFHKVAFFHPHYLIFTPPDLPVQVMAYADDITITSTHNPHTRMQPRNTYNHTYIKFLPGQNKTTCTLFTPDPAEYTSSLDLKINNNALPMATHSKVLGLTLDPKLTYSTHIHNISVHAHKPLQIIKTLTATGWGKQKETLLATYKAVMRPALEYVSSI